MHLSGLCVKVVAEQIAVEVFAELAEEIIEVLFCQTPWLYAQHIPQVARASEP